MEGSSLVWARYLVSGIAPARKATTKSARGRGHQAAAPDRSEDNGRARGLSEIRFAQVKRETPAPDGRRARCERSGLGTASRATSASPPVSQPTRQYGAISSATRSRDVRSCVVTRDGELRDHLAVVGDRDPHRLSCSLSLRRAEHEVTFLDERDSDPRIALVKDGDDPPEQLVGFAALLDEPADRLDRARVRAHTSRVSPSKERIASLYDSGIGTALRSSRSTRTSVCVAVTISSSSRARYAASS